MKDQDVTPGDEKTRVSDATRQAERKEAQMPADAGPEPTAEEAAAAERNDVDPKVAASEKAFVEQAADVKGEGRLP